MAKARAGIVFTCGVLLPTPSSRMNKLEHTGAVCFATNRSMYTLHVNSCAREGVSEDCSCWLSICLSNLGTSRGLRCSLCSCSLAILLISSYVVVFIRISKNLWPFVRPVDFVTKQFLYVHIVFIVIRNHLCQFLGASKSSELFLFVHHFDPSVCFEAIF